MSLRVSSKKYNIWFFIIFLCFCKDAFPENPYKSGEVRADHPKGCAYVRCNRGDQCVSRKFWCKNPPCPSMLYCSKSRKESLKGPLSCEAVRCSKGFICLVRVRHCRWGEGCGQQIARCISERDYYEGPASCADFRCPSGHRCILRESLCARPPCKLLKSCANTKDANIWLEGCKSLGCLSEHECFLRRPSQDCAGSPCKHTPDCSAKSEGELEIGEQCRGWVCPKGQECSAHTKGPCKHEGCRISRSCHKPLILPFNVSRSPQNSWRDNTRLSFYSKGKNSFTPGINRSLSVSTMDKITRVNGTNKKYPINLENGKFREIYGVAPNSRPFSKTPDVASGPVIKPSVTSLSAWLNHLKLVTGVEAIEIWVKRSDKQDNYEDFIEWLESVKDMLGTAAYDLWLEEVRAMTVTSRTFQKWLPPSNRSTSKNDDDLEKKTNVFLAKNETPLGKSIVSKDNSIGNVPGSSPTLPTIGINDWSRLQSANPNFQQTYQSSQSNFGNSEPWANPVVSYRELENIQQEKTPSQPIFGNFGLWSNSAVPYPGFENVGLLNPSYQQFHTNWSYQQPIVNNPTFLLPNMWQDQFIPPFYPQWQQPQDDFEIFPINQIPELPDTIVGSMGEVPMNFYSQNFTDNYGSAWGKYFLEPYVTSQFVPPMDFGAYPENVRNLGYPNWRDSSYGPASLGDLPHRRLKHDGSQDAIGNSRYNQRYEDEKLRGPSLDSSFYYRGFPGDFVERRMPDYHLHRRDYNGLNLHEKKNHDHPVDVDPETPPIRDFADNGYSNVYKPEYHWRGSYPQDRLYKIDGTLPPSFTTSDSFTSFETNDEVSQKTFTGDRINDVPGQAMEFPDLWNSRYRNPSNSILRATTKEGFGNRDAVTMSRPTSSTSSTTPNTPNPTPSTSKITAPLPSKVSSFKDTANRNNHQSEEDDGIYPLLLSLQGYIESPLTQFFPNFARSIKNTSILPVYTINGDVRTNDDYDDYYETQDENPARRKNREPGIDDRYSKLLNFKTVFGIEVPRTRQNLTDNDFAVKNRKWEYEDDVDDNIRDPPNFWLQMQTPIPSNDDSSNVNRARDWVVDSSGLRNEGKIESDYYDERIDYADDAVPGGAMYFDPEKINDDDSLDHEETPDDLNDSFYQDSDHKRVKKNRPL